MTRSPLRDRELVDALDGRPELLAVADAVAAAAPPRGRSLRRAAAPVALAVAALAALVVAAPWRAEPFTAERALAAIGDRPVLHAVVTNVDPKRALLDLETGRSLPVVEQVEYWFDAGAGRLRARVSIDGRRETEFVQGPDGFVADNGQTFAGQGEPARLDPALSGFASRYREALDSGAARVVGERTVEGRTALVLRFGVGPAGEEVALDPESYRPLAFRWLLADGAQRWWRVISIESVDRDPALFAPPARSPDRPSELTAGTLRTLAPAEVADAFGRPAEWPGPAVGGVELTEIQLDRVRPRWRDGRETEARGLELVYGDPRDRDARSLVVFVGTSAVETFAFTRGPLPDPGYLRLDGVPRGDRAAEMWFGSMQRDGLVYSFRSPSRELVVEAARSLSPIPPS